MSATIEMEPVQTFSISKGILIDAPPEIAFEALLEELGPGSELPDGTSFPMKLEPWPGGRWYRDRGEAGGFPYGHLWGHVQVIKAPVLLELCGPMMMSFAAFNHVQYRLSPEGAGTDSLFSIAPWAESLRISPMEWTAAGVTVWHASRRLPKSRSL